MALKAVVFDLDDTLAVPEQDRETLLSSATEQTGAPKISRQEYLAAHRRHHTHETRAQIFEVLLSRFETDVEPDDLAGAYREAISDALVPVPGVVGLVSELRTRYSVGLLTNGPVVAQRNKLETLGWTDLFDDVRITGELDAGKPDRRAFESILELLSVSPSEAVYVGDQVDADVAGARNAGLKSIQVCFDGGPDPSRLADAHVDRIELASRLPDVVSTLE